jgi:hypothetical protein
VSRQVKRRIPRAGPLRRQALVATGTLLESDASTPRDNCRCLYGPVEGIL